MPSDTVPAPDAAHLAMRFAQPDASRFGPVPIWWWSGARLTRARLRWQMEQMVSQGVAQAVILDLAPTGPLYGALADDPPFMSEAWWVIFLGACEDANELGFRFWPYDQIGFSGANLQGRLITGHREWVGQSLGRLHVDLGLGGQAQRSLVSPIGSTPLTAHVVSEDGRSAIEVPIIEGVARTDRTSGVLDLVYAQPRDFDYFNRQAFGALIDTVHGEFERRAGQWFGSVIVGFFQDELPAMPTWSVTFRDTFAERYGYDLGPVIGALWDDPVPTTQDAPTAAAIRHDFHEHRARLAHHATFGPLQDWLDSRGLICGFDQQSPAREGDPVGATRLYGNYLSLHGTYGAPGSDHWGDSKVHSSLAHAGDKPRTWLEAFHSSGWGGTLEETYDWLAPFVRRGATLYSPHAVYYSTVGGWWEWAPPSTCWRQPYWSEYGIFAGAVARLSELFTTGRHVADTVLLFPTSTVQSNVTIDGALPDALEAGRLYHHLNGMPAWYAERPGLLDGSGHDYDIFDESVLATAVVEDGLVRVGAETYRNVVLPGATVLRADVAAKLADLASGGGTVILVGSAPGSFVGGSGQEDGIDRFRQQLAAGTIGIVADAEDVGALLARHDVWVEADAPHLLRRVGDTWVVALFAHDAATGTMQPIVKRSGSDLDPTDTPWDAYWREMTAHGYEFRPVTDRRATITVHGVPDLKVQQWDPRTGEGFTVETRVAANGDLSLSIGFEHGTVAILVFGEELPVAHGTRAGVIVAEQPVDAWELEAHSLLDNDGGDFADPRRTGILPIEVWEFEHWTGDDGPTSDTATVTATFGPFADVHGPAAHPGATPWSSPIDGGAWQPAAWSLSRGMEQDPVHRGSLGPKGYVPEEFLRWSNARTGEWVAAKLSITVPATDEPLTLTVGANATKHVLIDGTVAETDGDGYLATTSIEAGRHEIQLWLRAEREEPIRAAFAVVRDVEAFRRPEWLEPADQSHEPTTWEAALSVVLGALPTDARILVGSEQPCTVIVNGTEIGRQSDFDPYPEHRFGRLHPYDIRESLVIGDNSIRLLSLEGRRRPAILVDTVPAAFGGLGITSATGAWESARDGTPTPIRRRSLQWHDPRIVCLEAKPHPLPGASWLERSRSSESTVVDLVPDRDPSDRRAQHLRFVLPIGTTGVTVPTELRFSARTADRTYQPVDHRIQLDAPSRPGELMTLSFETSDGRRAGAVLSAAVQVETTSIAGPLSDWASLGLASLAGEVVYRASVDRPSTGSSERLVLDLGSVRGSVAVEVDGVAVGALAWSPYRLDITDAVAQGSANTPLRITVRVRNTLAGYLRHASPTPAVFECQVRAGLFGPVRITRHAGDGSARAHR